MAVVEHVAEKMGVVAEDIRKCFSQLSERRFGDGDANSMTDAQLRALKFLKQVIRALQKQGKEEQERITICD